VALTRYNSAPWRMSESGQTRPRRPPSRRAYPRPVLLSKRTHFGPVGSGQPWALCHEHRSVHTAMRNCTGDEGGSFEFDNQVLISSHRKLLWSKAMVVNVAEKSGHDPVRHGRERRA